MSSDIGTNVRDDEAVCSRFVNAARHFRQTRAANFSAMIGFGSCQQLLKIENGAVVSAKDLTSLRPLASWDFAIAAPSDAWLRFWEPMPAAGWHDLFALTRHGRMRIEGNLHPFMAHLQFVKDLLASPRAMGDQA